MAAWNREDLAWLAGLIEGEGSISLKKGSPTVTVQMTDLDVVQRAHEIAGLGTVYGPYKPANGMNVKPLWIWAIGGGRQSYALLVAILPWLGERRTKRTKDVLSAWLATGIANGAKRMCAKGHSFTQENTYLKPGGSRGCRKCRAGSLRELRARRRAN